ncbi:MAG: molybdopterin molybdotransferase MoeA, partial [Cytophagales bacterium]|nr:molybdopterin molybdotransferase MoeA [Cytophagales bacterium]
MSEAKDKVLSFARSFGEEIRALDEVQGRVLAEDILTDRPYPPFNRAAMDGYAIRYEDFMGNSSREFNVLGEIHAGDGISIDWTTAGDCVKIMTGAPTPLCFDTIIRVEDSVSLGQGKVKFECGTIKLGQNISKMGEDISKGEVLLSKGIELVASELGALAVVGKQRVKVKKMPKLALYSTGNEVRSVGEDVLPHQIRDSNMYSLGSHFLRYCGRPIVQKVLPDKPTDIREAILEANQADIIVL